MPAAINFREDGKTDRDYNALGLESETKKVDGEAGQWSVVKLG